MAKDFLPKGSVVLIHRDCRIWATRKKNRGYTCELPPNAPTKYADRHSVDDCKHLINQFLNQEETV